MIVKVVDWIARSSMSGTVSYITIDIIDLHTLIIMTTVQSTISKIQIIQIYIPPQFVGQKCTINNYMGNVKSLYHKQTPISRNRLLENFITNCTDK